MIPAIALLVALAPQDSPRLRTIMPNGAAILVEKMPAKSLSVQLFASSRGVEESPERHGWRHLLEHLTLKGRDPKNPLDIRSESKGIFITGRTYRDAMQLEVTCSPTQLTAALELLKEVLSPLETTPEQIQAEVGVMKEELALDDDAGRLARAAWIAAYGPTGLDAQGDLESMAKATPETLVDLQSKHFAPANLVLVVSGPISLSKATEECRQFMLERRGEPVAGQERHRGVGGRVEAPGAFGESRAVPVGSFRDKDTLACLIGAFGIASRVPNSFVTYTPCMTQGVIIVGQTESASGIGLLVDSFSEADLAQAFNIGKSLTRRWLRNYLATPAGNGYVRGLMLLQEPAVRIEQVLEDLDAVSFDKFKISFQKFNKDNAIVAVGARQ